MKTVIYYLSLILLFSALIMSGCYTSKQTTTESELRKQQDVGPIRILTVDTTIYTFKTFTFNDSTIDGSGTVKKKGVISRFEGSIPFSEIVFIERRVMNLWKALWLIPVTGAVGGGLASLNDPPEFEIWRPTPLVGSCPYIYAFDRSEYILEAEAFAMSLSKPLEMQTLHHLPSLYPVNDQLKVRVSNERPEIHLINSVNLFTSDARGASSVVLDNENVLWPIPNTVSPVAAQDHSGKDILAVITKKDGMYWESDLAHISAFSGFRDRLEVKFDIPQGVSEAALVIDAINTELIIEVWNFLGAVLGDATLEFYHVLENDTHFQEIFRKWTRESSLFVEVEDGNGWKAVGTILPEANVTPFSRAIRLYNLDGFQKSLTVRLSSLTDVWRIDALSMDFTQVDHLPLHQLDIISVIASNGVECESAIKSNDSLYALIFPPEYLDITFDSTPVEKMQNPVYVFAAQGYLYEWFPVSARSVSSVISDEMTGSDRVEMLKLLIQHKDIFLPPIYAKWKKIN